MKIIRNAAQCVHCNQIIESTNRHDFVVHYCKEMPRLGNKWEGDKLVSSGEITYNFFVDGGKDYIRRGGRGFRDINEYEETKFRDTEDHSGEGGPGGAGGWS